MLAALGAISAVAATRSVAAQAGANTRSAVTPLGTVDAEYARLLPLWREERKQFAASSRTADSWAGPHGQAIIALGPAIIPHLIREVRKGDFFFNVPLAGITKVDVTDGHYVSEQATSALWLRWWDAATPARP